MSGPRRAISALAVLLLATGCAQPLPEVAEPCAAWSAPGLYRFTLPRDDTRDRKAWVHVPPGAGPRDLVVMLHGGGQSAKASSEVTAFTRLADRDGFVAVFPEGLGWPLRSWNAGDCCGTSGDLRRGIDDVAFLDALVEALSPRVCGDRVLATGFSNGAMLAHRWGCESDRVDALAPVSGPLTVHPERCAGDPLPIRHYHGTDDPVVPAQGGDGGRLETHDFRSVEETFEVWRDRNRCADGPPEVVRLGDDTVCEVWSCAVPTELCMVEGWGHAWPGGVHSARTEANATGAIWRWFQQLR